MLFRVSREFLRGRWREVVVVVVLQLGATFAALGLPGLNARIINEGVTAGDTAFIWRLGVWMFVLTLAQGVATACAVFCGSRVAMGLGAWLRERVFIHIQALGVQDVQYFGAGALVTRSTNDIQQIQTVIIMLFAMMVQAPIMGVGAVVLAYQQDKYLSVLLWVMVPILVFIAGVVMKFLAPQFLLQQQRLDALNMILHEELTGQRVIRAFARQDFMSARYTQANENLRLVGLRIGSLFALGFPLMSLTVSVTHVGIVWWGGAYIDAGVSQVGSLFAFFSYVGMLFGSVMMSATMLMMLPRAEVAAERIREILIFVPSPSMDTEGIKVHDNVLSQGCSFALDNVHLQYPGAQYPVLAGIDVSFQPGSFTALIGPTGSGKTTLINLLPRLLDPTTGVVRVNGIDARKLNIADVRRRIAVVPQKTYLFAGTIASSVSGVDKPNALERERVLWALEGACALDFVSALPEGIDSVVEPGGVNYSGGQRQRLAIARALFREADLYIFDDAFSALDQATEATLRAQLAVYTKGAAIIVVSQRVASVQTADTILVLDGTRIVGRGTHKELLDSCVTYQEIAESQRECGGIQ